MYLKNSGIDPEQYSGLALGMGVERLIMARKNLPDIRLIRSSDPRVVKQMTNMEKFKNVSNQPAMFEICHIVLIKMTQKRISVKLLKMFLVTS